MHGKEPMKLTILGSGDAFGSGGRFNTCLHLEAGGETVMIDCGGSSPLALNRSGLDRNAIGTWLFTHFHGDHFAGLPFLLLDAFFVTRRTAPLLIAGPKGIAERTHAIVEALYPGFADFPRAFALDFLEIRPDAPAMLGGLSVTALPARHDERAGPCQSYRFTAGGRTLAFTGDTTWTDAMVDLAAGSDVLLSECNSHRTKLATHLDWETLESRLGTLATQRLILTHMSGEMLAFTDPIPAERAFDGMVVSL